MKPEIQAALEALLFASDSPLELPRLAEVLELEPDEVQEAVETLRVACEAPERGLALVEVGGGLRLVTRPDLAPVLVRLQRLRMRSRLSRAALETLAIIAYRQPISRPEIEQLRGVGAESVLAALLERRMVRIVGRKSGPGRPMLYGTTRDFLEHFGLRDLGDLPPFELPAPVAAPGAAGPADAEAGAALTPGEAVAAATAAPGDEVAAAPGRPAEGAGASPEP